MSHQNVLSHRVDGVQFSLWPDTKAAPLPVRPKVAAASPAPSDNYLPGLRRVENEVETYFSNDFVWLGY